MMREKLAAGETGTSEPEARSPSGEQLRTELESLNRGIVKFMDIIQQQKIFEQLKFYQTLFDWRLDYSPYHASYHWMVPHFGAQAGMPEPACVGSVCGKTSY
jgi:hypothetical protein